jgi:hypothetical protein
MRKSSLQLGNMRSVVVCLLLAAICARVATAVTASAGPEQIVVEVAASWALACVLNDSSRSVELLVDVTIDGVPSCCGFGAIVAGSGDGLVDPGISPLSPGEQYSRTNLADFMVTFVPAVAPGTQYRYSNVGSGPQTPTDRDVDADFHLLLRRMVLDDLGLDNTFGRHSYRRS